MMRRTLLDDVGLFDESLPACEDYDLWLRVTCRYPVGLIGRPYIVKRGGHADQLSRMDELDKHRIRALIKILDSGHLSAGQRSAALSMLRAKAQIYGEGCRKRGRMEEAHFYSGLSRTEEIDRSDMPMP
jgi:GT2 family glycosyltransferase